MTDIPIRRMWPGPHRAEARSSPGRAARPSRSSRGVLRRKEGEGGAGPAMMLSTVPLNFSPGTCPPGSRPPAPADPRDVGFLIVRTTHTSPRAATARSDWPGETIWPSSTLFRVTYPSAGRGLWCSGGAASPPPGRTSAAEPAPRAAGCGLRAGSPRIAAGRRPPLLRDDRRCVGKAASASRSSSFATSSCALATSASVSAFSNDSRLIIWRS